MDNLYSAGATPSRGGVGRSIFLGRSKWVGTLLIVAALGLNARPGLAQAATTVEEAAVRVSAVVRRSSPQIKLVWSAINTQAVSYTIWRKTSADFGWGTPLATLPSTLATEYADNTVAVGTAYEYRIRRNSTSGEGYISAGIDVPAIESRGTVVLVVDNTHTTALATELSLLQSDLQGDGWQVLRHNVAPTATPPQVKAMIRADYLAAPTQVKAVFLLGHVAVPYSGAMWPDGHPDHFGAWPADAYYSDMRGTWTDNRVNTSIALRPENRNVPGDGKFDQSTLPLGSPDLQVGRVDLSNLSVAYFQLSETELLRRYLRKDHQFRHKVFTVPERALIDDHFGFYGGETFANNGWRNFSALLGESNTNTGAYFSTLASQSYLMVYACGGGSFFGANGVGDVRQFGVQPVKGVFNMLFGSYFGDWDNTDNFLRGALASDGYTLTNCWAGRPNWQLHHMGLGQTIGFATQVSQSGSGLYQTNGSSEQVHVALMGDPTLRLHVLAPPTALTASNSGSQAALSWAASTDAALGYYVYRATSAAAPFTRITAQPVAATTFVDATPLLGASTYMVRAIELKSSASGTYYNLSQGAFSDFTAVVPMPTNGIWLGTQSTDWNTPANWSTGVVPTDIDEASIPAGTPFAPTVGGTFTVGGLILGPQARLTVAAGGRLTVRKEPELQPATGISPLTSLVLASGTATSPGGQLEVLDHTLTQAGLALSTGTALTVGDYAELRLLGHLGTTGGTVSFAPLGRLTFANDPSAATQGIQHSLGGTAPLIVGVLAVTDSRETVVLNGPVQVLSKVENLGTIVTNDNLMLLSTLGKQAILAPVTPGLGQPRTLGTYSGMLRVQVYIDGSRNAGLGYRHLAAPVTGAIVSSLGSGTFAPVVNPLYNTQGNGVMPFPTVYSYSQARVGTAPLPGQQGFDQGWMSPGSLSEPLASASGYSVNMRGNATMSFSGTAFTNPSFSLSQLNRGTAAEAGWQLLGNPFAAPINWDLLTASSTRYINLNTALYVFKSSGAYAGTFASYVPGSGGGAGLGINGGNNVVAVGQGFFVRSTSVNGLLRFSLDDLFTSPNATTVQRDVSDTRPRLTLALRNPGRTLAHQTAIYFQAGATTGIDANYDAGLLSGPGQALMLASMSGSAEYSINGQPELSGADVQVPLLLSTTAAGQYELAAETLANLPTGYRAYLRDAVTGIYTDLAVTPVVGVTLAANTRIAGRYTIVLSTQPRVLATAPAELAALVSVYPNPAHGTATLLLPHTLRGRQPVTVAVLNTLGQVVRECRYAVNAAETLDIPLADLPPGLYTVQVGTAVGSVSRRLVIK
jgi:hypothetical protein